MSEECYEGCDYEEREEVNEEVNEEENEKWEEVKENERGNSWWIGNYCTNSSFEFKLDFS